MGFVSKNIIANTNAQMIEGATFYDFGILSSNVHMAWMRAIYGRMKSDYAYSGSIVYNNFPWPSVSKSDKQKIHECAQNIIKIREEYHDCSLADLYDVVLMPKVLREAHRANDRAVMRAYGFKDSMTEEECVVALMQLYEEKIRML